MLEFLSHPIVLHIIDLIFGYGSPPAAILFYLLMEESGTFGSELKQAFILGAFVGSILHQARIESSLEEIKKHIQEAMEAMKRIRPEDNEHRN